MHVGLLEKVNPLQIDRFHEKDLGAFQAELMIYTISQNGFLGQNFTFVQPITQIFSTDRDQGMSATRASYFRDVSSRNNFQKDILVTYCRTCNISEKRSYELMELFSEKIVSKEMNMCHVFQTKYLHLRNTLFSKKLKNLQVELHLCFFGCSQIGCRTLTHESLHPKTSLVSKVLLDLNMAILPQTNTATL